MKIIVRSEFWKEAEMNVKLNDSVIVYDPKHNDSSHKYSFKGIVTGFRGNHILVKDQQNDVWEIELDEIENINPKT